MPVIDRSVGNEYEAPCPSCDKMMYMHDITIDSCLKSGYRGECEHCGSPYEITEVAYTAIVWLETRAP